MSTTRAILAAGRAPLATAITQTGTTRPTRHPSGVLHQGDGGLWLAFQVPDVTRLGLACAWRQRSRWWYNDAVDDGDWAREVNIDQPSAARMYDYYLGGSHNFASDREAAEQVIRAIPNVRQIAAANRTFVRNAVRHLLDLGVRQFLDIGSGLPTVGNVHEIAQAADPQARVVYVDIDPVAIIHAGHLLEGNERAVAIVADLRHPEAILSHRQVRETLDLTQPVGLLLVSMLHFLPDADAYPAVAHLRSILAAGSGLVISHVAAEGMARQNSDAAAAVYRRSTAPGGAVRSRAQIEKFFHGYDLLPPGLAWVSQWQAGGLADVGEHPEHIGLLAAVARKPPMAAGGGRSWKWAR